MSETVRGGGALGRPRFLRLPLILRLALRDLRAGARGFAIFVACIALGVAAIAGIGSLAGGLKDGLARDGQIVLGGDIAVSVVHRRASLEERTFFAGRGAVSEIATLRGMARDTRGGNSALVRIKAVDRRYPLYGGLGLSEGDADAYQARGTAAAEPLLLEQLEIGLGDSVRIGDADIRITAIIEREPDRLSETRPPVGPRLLMSLETLEATGLIQPGSLIHWRYRIAIPEAKPEQLAALAGTLETQFPDAGFTLRDRRDPNPRLGRLIDRFAQFLTLVGITTLMIGGIGVANAIASYLARKRATIATFKCLGASGATIFRIYLTEIALLAGLGTATGLAAGAVFPFAVSAAAGDALPLKIATGFQPFALLLAAVYGFLTALVFVLWPLGRARDIPAALLMRLDVSGEHAQPRWPYLAASAACALVLAGIAVAGAESRNLAAWAVAGLTAVFVFFLWTGALVEHVARRSPRPARAELSLARASLSGPGGLARPVSLSLGAALSLLAALSLVNHSLTEEFRTGLPEDAPSYFMLDIPRGQVDAFTGTIKTLEPDAWLDRAPMLRGRIVRLNGVDPKDVRATPGVQWVLNGDRGLTYAEEIPEGSKLVKGAWWPKDYDGPPLVSFEREIADGLGLEIGDTVTVNVLGRNVEARIDSLRDVEWESLAINFVMVFSPNTLRSAPHNFLATIKLPDVADAKREARIAREIGDRFPSVTAVRVRDAIDAFREIAERVMAGIRAAGGLTLAVGAIVLAGALSVAHPRRIRETVIFKTLGATRTRIVAAHLIEYGLLALVTGISAAGLGTLGAWLVLTQVMDSVFTFSGLAVLQAVGVAALLVLLFGAVGTWRVLGASPARRLRQTRE